MGGGVFIYFILLTAITAIHSLFFGEPLSKLWFNDHYSTLERLDLQDLPIWEQYLLEMGLGRLECDVIIGGILGLVFVGISRVMSAHLAWARRIDDDFSLFFQGQTSLQLTLLALSSSIVEEIVFRGWLQSLIGLTGASILFGILHIPPQKSHWPWMLTALIMGFVFGGLYEWRGSVTAPVIAHFTINHFNLHALAKRSSSQPLTKDEKN